MTSGGFFTLDDASFIRFLDSSFLKHMSLSMNTFHQRGYIHKSLVEDEAMFSYSYPTL